MTDETSEAEQQARAAGAHVIDTTRVRELRDDAERIMPWHDAPPCPSCGLPVATPAEHSGHLNIPKTVPVNQLWCPSCGETWAEYNMRRTVQAWMSWGTYEGHRETEASTIAPLRAELEYEQGRAVTAEQNVRRYLDANAALRTQLAERTAEVEALRIDRDGWEQNFNNAVNAQRLAREQMAERDRTIANMTASRDRWRLKQLERSSEVVQLRDALLRIALAFDAGTEAELAEAINNGKAALADPGEAESEETDG